MTITFNRFYTYQVLQMVLSNLGETRELIRVNELQLYKPF